jgi:hypothetical protein
MDLTGRVFTDLRIQFAAESLPAKARRQTGDETQEKRGALLMQGPFDRAVAPNINLPSLVSSLFKSHGRSVREHLGRAALAEFRRVITHANHSIGADLDSVLNHPIKGLAASLLTHDGKFLNISANDGLQAADETATDPSRANNDSPDNAKIFANLATIYADSCCNDHKSQLKMDNGKWTIPERTNSSVSQLSIINSQLFW